MIVSILSAGMHPLVVWFTLFLCVCGNSAIKFDKFITGHDWYYIVQHRTCGFIHCDKVYKCSIETSSARNGQYNCTRVDQRAQIYRMYTVNSQQNGFYCEDIMNTDNPLTKVTVMKGRCCKNLIECNQHEKRVYELAVMQHGFHNEDPQQEEEDYQQNYASFAAELYQILVKLYPYENVMVCPLCVMDSLRLLRSGSRGITWHQITDILKTNESMHQETENTSVYTSRSAVFYDSERKLHPYFLKTAERLGTTTRPLPFSSDRRQASSVIDAWLQNIVNVDVQKTGSGTSDYNEDLVVASVIEFNGNWSTVFDPYKRVIQKFTSLDGTVYEVEMLNSAQPVRYKMKRDQELEATVIEIPFKDSTVVMRLVVPDTVDGLPLIEDHLTSDVLQGLDKQLRLTDVFLTLPQINHTYRKNLQRAVTHMGADRLFRNADLSGIYEDAGTMPRIQRYIQAASIKLNNYFKASAAAVGNLEAIRVSPEQITADRPFMFTLEDTASKNYLLIGRVAH